MQRLLSPPKKSPEQRRRDLEKQKADVEAKLAANRSKLDEARATAKLEGFVQSQSGRLARIVVELSSLPTTRGAAPSLALEDAEEAVLLRRIDEIRAARHNMEPADSVSARERCVEIEAGGELENYVAAVDADTDEDMPSSKMRIGVRARPRAAVRPIDSHPHHKEAILDKTNLVKKAIGK